MKKFFSSASTFVRALPVVILFELLFRLIMVAIGAPALTLALKLTMKAAGISYLSDEHVVLFLIHPVTIVSLIILLFLIGLFSFVELSALAGCFSCYHEHKRMSVMGMIRTGFGSFKKAFGVRVYCVFWRSCCSCRWLSSQCHPVCSWLRLCLYCGTFSALSRSTAKWRRQSISF